MTTTEELKILADKARKAEIEYSDHKLAQASSSVDAFYFLIYGAILGLSINLLANILHDYFKQFKWYYYMSVVLFVVIASFLIFNFLKNKLKAIEKEDKFFTDSLKKKIPNPFKRLKKRIELQKTIKQM